MIRKLLDFGSRVAKGAIAGVILACIVITAWQSTLWARHEHDIALAVPGAVVIGAYAWALANSVWNRAVSRAAAKLVAKDEGKPGADAAK